MQPIYTSWATENELAKKATIAHILRLAESPVSVDHAKSRAKEIAKEWPEFIGLLKEKQSENTRN